MNPRENTVTLHQGMTAAMFYAVDAIGPEIDVTNDNNDVETKRVRKTFQANGFDKKDAIVPSHLEDLYER